MKVGLIWMYFYLRIWNDLHLECISFNKAFDSLQVHPSATTISKQKKIRLKIKNERYGFGPILLDSIDIYNKKLLCIYLQVVCVKDLEFLN